MELPDGSPSKARAEIVAGGGGNGREIRVV